MRSKPYTNQELFAILCKEVTLPKQILDYQIPAREEAEILSYEWNLWNSFQFGANEGIYLEIGAEFYRPEHRIVRFGTFKTLRADLEAMREMGRLLADIVYATRMFVDANLDDFDWTGYQVRGLKKDALTSYAVDYPDLDSAMTEIEKIVDAYDCVQLYDRGKHERSYFGRNDRGILTRYKTKEDCMQNCVMRDTI